MVALILNPLVRMLERARLPRGLAILPCTWAGSRSLAGIGRAAGQSGQHPDHPLRAQRAALRQRRPTRTSASVQNWLDNHGIKVHIQQQGQTALHTLQKNILKRSSDIVSFSRDLLSRS